MGSFIDGGNSFKEAAKLRFLRFGPSGSSVGVTDKLSPGETVDWYQVETKGRSSRLITLNVSGSAPIDQTIEVFFRPSAKKQGLGKLVATFSGESTAAKKLKALPGTYFLKVSLGRGASASDADKFVINLTAINLISTTTSASFSQPASSTSSQSMQGKAAIPNSTL
jgi:hypothetical protein